MDGGSEASDLMSYSSFLLLSLISDKMFPALGFGAQLPPDWKVSGAGLFPFGRDGICVSGLSGICKLLEAHPAALCSLHLSQTHTLSSA